MPLTRYPDMDQLLRPLCDQLRRILERQLIGLYLYGSLATGDFDPQISDIDLLAATASAVNDAQFARLHRFHREWAARNPFWEGRLEIAYVSVAALQTFKAHDSPIAVMSPGEPFHRKPAGRDYLINWWAVREHGLVLCGPPPATLIAPVSREEFRQAVREHARCWRRWIEDVYRRPALAYAILTLCRALYAHQEGDQASKIEAARWAQARFPEWADLIANALAWRQAWQKEDVDHEASRPEALRFVHFAVDHITAGARRPPDCTGGSRAALHP
jgi:predicted nucleotidyltransferase